MYNYVVISINDSNYQQIQKLNSITISIAINLGKQHTIEQFAINYTQRYCLFNNLINSSITQVPAG